MLYAPFVKPADKVKKDGAELSFSDFQPKRMALSYDPPTIVLEYLVPSTGKLYHHKMKLRHLKAESDVDEMMDYLEKRHPLYFISKRISKTQVRDLVRRLKYRLQSQAALKSPPAAKEKENSTTPGATSKISMNTKF